MPVRETPRGEPPAAVVRAPIHRRGLTRFACASYPDAAAGVNDFDPKPDDAKPRPPCRIAYPNLAPTRPPAVAADAALWPAWTDSVRYGLGPVDDEGLRAAFELLSERGRS